MRVIKFGPFQIIKTSLEKSNLNLTKMVWTRQKDLDPTKIIWKVQIWLCTNPLGRVQLLKNCPENYLDSPLRFGPDQNNLDGPKSFWTNKRTRYTSTTTWIDTQNDFCNFHTTINYILLFWCWHFKNKKKLKDWMKNWKKKKKEKQISSQSYEKWKKYYQPPTPH